MHVSAAEFVQTYTVTSAIELCLSNEMASACQCSGILPSATRYEDEDAEEVCEAMERMAQLFLSDSGKVEDVTEQDSAKVHSDEPGKPEAQVLAV